MIYLLTNRAIEPDGQGGERIANDGREAAQPVFRIATVDLHASDPRRDKVELVPDQFVDQYDTLQPDADPRNYAGSKRMFLDLYQRMRDEPSAKKGDVLFFLHGFQYTLADSLRHLRKLHELYVRPAASPVSHLVYFSWPSRGQLTQYRNDRRDAIESGKLLGRVFRKARQFLLEFFAAQPDPRGAFCGHRIHLAAHSMGNMVLYWMTHELNTYPDPPFALFGELLLLNADCDWDAFNPDKPLHRLPEYGERIHIYNHQSDDALWVSANTKNWVKRLGRQGPADLELLPARTLVVDCSGLKKAAGKDPRKDEFASVAGEVSLGTKTPSKETLLDHWGYLYRPQVVADIHSVLRGESSSRIAGRTPTTHPRLYRLQDG